MKKLLLLILTFTMALGLSGCIVSTSTLNDYKEELDEVSLELEVLQAEIDANTIATEAQLEAFLVALEALSVRIDNIGSTVGLNGQEAYHEASESIVYTMAAIELTVTEMKDTFLKDGAPGYIVDEFGNYISFEKLGYMLKVKYFEDDTINEVDMFSNGTDAHFRIGVINDMSEEEILARMLLMIEEFRNYALYALNCNRVIVHVYRFDDHDHQTKLEINQTIILNDYFIILPEGAFYEDYDMKLQTDTELDLALIESYYDNFILSEVFSGYILDFK